MQINVHGATESTFSSWDDYPSAKFFQSKAFEWTQGRRDGDFTCESDDGYMTVQFADIRSFAVEVIGR